MKGTGDMTGIDAGAIRGRDAARQPDGDGPATFGPTVSARPAVSPAPVVRTLRRLLVPVALLLLWQLVISLGVYTRGQLPAPLDVVAAARELAATGQLWPNILISIQRVLLGFACGSAVAIVVGLAVGLSRTVEEMVAPTIQAIRAVPSLAWVPLLLLWMGLYEGPKLTLVAIGVFFPVYTNLVAGIRQIDRKLVEVGRAYGLRGPSLVGQVLLPASLPSLLTGLRLGLAQGWLFLVAAELIAAQRGLGFLLIDSQNTGRVDIIVFSIIVLAVLGKTSDWLLQLLERRLLRWSDTFRGGT
jgi:sulfonate transport system permease protein